MGLDARAAQIVRILAALWAIFIYFDRILSISNLWIVIRVVIVRCKFGYFQSYRKNLIRLDNNN